MHAGWCISCGGGLSIRREEGPLRLYSCASCRASSGVALECSDCRLRFNGVLGKTPCPKCLESELADRHIYPGKGWKGPI